MWRLAGHREDGLHEKTGFTTSTVADDDEFSANGFCHGVLGWMLISLDGVG